MSPPDTTARPAEATNRRLARTINLGLDLGAPEEAGWTIDVGDEHLERCAQAGSSAVRLGSCFGLHASPPTPTSCTLVRWSGWSGWSGSSSPPPSVGWQLGGRLVPARKNPMIGRAPVISGTTPLPHPRTTARTAKQPSRHP
jgi:hypothetical protein